MYKKPINDEPGLQSLTKGQPVFLTWIAHRRTRELSRQLELRLVELLSARHGIRRYVDLLWRTTRFLFSERAPVIVVQSPSLVLTAYVLALRTLLRNHVIIDAHNEGVQPFLHGSAVISSLTMWTHRIADRVIVTNADLASIVIRNGGRAIILPDPIPTAPAIDTPPPSDRFRVVIVATFADDEPIGAIFDAARTISDDYEFLVTGNSAKLPRALRESLPSNVRLTGYLEEADYWRVLSSAHVVVDLTTMESCLVCGAYEAIAVGTPLVLSNNPASIGLFNRFAEFTDNTAPSIKTCLMRVQASYASYKSSIPVAREMFRAEWSEKAMELRKTIDDLMQPPPSR